MRRPVQSEYAPPRGLNGVLSRAVKEFRVRAAARELVGGRSVLDLGCGLCEILARIGAETEYVGVERDPWMVERARALFPQRRFLKADIEEAGFDPGSVFDRILLVAVWEHLSAPAELLRRASGWLAEGGLLILTTPSPRAHRVIDAGARLRLLSSLAAEEHDRLWTIEEIAEEGRREGWRVVRSRRFLGGMNQLVVLGRT